MREHLDAFVCEKGRGETYGRGYISGTDIADVLDSPLPAPGGGLLANDAHDLNFVGHSAKVDGSRRWSAGESLGDGERRNSPSAVGGRAVKCTWWLCSGAFVLVVSWDPDRHKRMP